MHRAWELHPDDAGYLGRVRDGQHEFAIFTDDIKRLGLPAELERELRVLHELSTRDPGESESDYDSLLLEIDKLSEPDMAAGRARADLRLRARPIACGQRHARL